MKEAIGALLRHRLSLDALPNHVKCPEGSDSWCRYHRRNDYKHKNPLPKAVAAGLKPVFDRLSLDSLLERCVDSFTQNAAESLYSVLWNLCPKRPFVGSTTATFCAGLAVIIYNDGHQAT